MRITGVPDAVAIAIALIGVRIRGTVVDGVVDQITVLVMVRERDVRERSVDRHHDVCRGVGGPGETERPIASRGDQGDQENPPEIHTER